MDRDPEIRREVSEPAALSYVQPEQEPTRADFTKAKVSYARGDGAAHVVVGAWLLTWGRPGRKDFENWLSEQDG